MPKAADPGQHERAIRTIALGYPEATEDFPWGHSAYKVRGKTFVFAGVDEGRFHLSVKLPISGDLALGLPFAEPTGYGLGRAGWVSASFGPGDGLPLGLLRAWIDESYRAVAPKRLLASLDVPSAPAGPDGSARATRGRGAGPASKRATARPRSSRGTGPRRPGAGRGAARGRSDAS